MSLTPEEREELTNLYADMAFGGFPSRTEAEKEEAQLRLQEAIWAALCHTTGRCGLGIDNAYPDTPQARIYVLAKKALLG